MRESPYLPRRIAWDHRGARDRAPAGMTRLHPRPARGLVLRKRHAHRFTERGALVPGCEPGASDWRRAARGPELDRPRCIDLGGWSEAPRYFNALTRGGVRSPQVLQCVDPGGGGRSPHLPQCIDPGGWSEAPTYTMHCTPSRSEARPASTHCVWPGSNGSSGTCDPGAPRAGGPRGATDTCDARNGAAGGAWPSMPPGSTARARWPAPLCRRENGWHWPSGSGGTIPRGGWIV